MKDKIEHRMQSILTSMVELQRLLPSVTDTSELSFTLQVLAEVDGRLEDAVENLNP